MSSCQVCAFLLNYALVRKVKTIVLFLLVGALIGGVGYFLFNFVRPKQAGINIETNPVATVYINDEQVGRTPYKATRKPGEISVRLIPDSFEKPLVPYETKITLISGIETVIRREFGETTEMSGGETLSFEKLGKNQIGLAIVTLPDSAQILIDGSDRAVAPYNTSNITPGDHIITIDANGFTERNIKVKAYSGYKLTLVVNLIPTSGVPEDAPTPTPEENQQKMLEILTTPVGFLRVRSEPSTLGDEVGQVDPGKQYALLDTDANTGWYKIEYETGKEGWISNQYAKIVDDGASGLTPTPTPTKKITPTEEP
jgi:hypothetical protein